MKRYYLKIHERHEDHSEDERTGGQPVFSACDEHTLALDGIESGKAVKVSDSTEIIIRSVSHHPATVRFAINRGRLSHDRGIDIEEEVGEGQRRVIFDNLNECSKWVELVVHDA